MVMDKQFLSFLFFCLAIVYTHAHQLQSNLIPVTLLISHRAKIDVGSVQEWFITNTNTEGYHPIHIHINHFQVYKAYF